MEVILIGLVLAVALTVIVLKDKSRQEDELANIFELDLPAVVEKPKKKAKKAAPKKKAVKKKPVKKTAKKAAPKKKAAKKK